MGQAQAVRAQLALRTEPAARMDRVLRGVAVVNQTDELIKAVVRAYAAFGAGCAMVMALKVWLEDLKKPVTANCTAGLLFVFVAADLLAETLWYHSAKLAGVALPMAAIALWGAWACARKLGKIVKEMQNAKNEAAGPGEVQDDVPTVPRAD